MGMYASTPANAYAASGAKGSSKLQIQGFKNLEMSESWLPLAMQTWKSIINFVYVLPERPSSLWQAQCVMFLLALSKSIIHIKDL